MSQVTSARSGAEQSIMPRRGLWNLTVTSANPALAALKFLDFTNETKETGALAGFVEDSDSPPTDKVNFTGSSIDGVVTFKVVIDQKTYIFEGKLNSTGNQIKDGTITGSGSTDEGTWSATAQPSWPTT